MTDSQNIRRINTDINPFEGWKHMSAMATMPAAALTFIPLAFGVVMFLSALGGKHREPRPLTPVTGTIATILLIVGLAAIIACLTADHRNRKVRRVQNANMSLGKINELKPILTDAGVPLPHNFAFHNAWSIVGGYAPFRMVEDHRRVLSYESNGQTVNVSAEYGQPFIIDIAPQPRR